MFNFPKLTNKKNKLENFANFAILMRNRRNSWIYKCIVFCLVAVSLYLAGDSSSYDSPDGETVSEIISSSSFSGRSVNYSFSAATLQCSAPRSSTYTNSLRTSFQTQRHNGGGSAKRGFTMLKAGKSMNEYSTSLFYKSIVRFPSGLNESSHRLIVLGKLII